MLENEAKKKKPEGIWMNIKFFFLVKFDIDF